MIAARWRKLDDTTKYVIFEDHSDSKTEALAQQLGIKWLDEGGHIFSPGIDDMLQIVYEQVHKQDFKKDILHQKGDNSQIPLEDLIAKSMIKFHLAATQIAANKINSIPVVDAARQYFILKDLGDMLANFKNTTLQDSINASGPPIVGVKNTNSDEEIGSDAYRNLRLYFELFTNLIRQLAAFKSQGPAAQDPDTKGAIEGLQEDRSEEYTDKSFTEHQSTEDTNTLREFYMAKNIKAAQPCILVRVGQLHKAGLVARLQSEDNIVFANNYNEFIDLIS